MPYHFERLSDFDFEALCRDLLSVALGVRFEHFAKGRDRGIDLRYSAPRRDTLLKYRPDIIVQCKHYLGTGYSGLKSHLKGKELPKIRVLAPRRYILATTVPLTPARKDELASILAPYVVDTGDIFGGTEIEALIANNPEIERRHFKLWLASSGVLERIVHSKVYNQTSMLQLQIEEHAKRYVQNESFHHAFRLLEQHRVCIVAGPPGIGKTTLAQMLLLQFSGEDYEPVLVSEDIDEAAGVWHPESKQFFYYDDFLGQTASHEKLGKNEDGRLSLFLERVNRSRNKLIILTTREYILAQAKTRYERLAKADFTPWKCIVSLEKYTKRDRAKILYNHLYFSELPSEMLIALRDSGKYKAVITHRNYSPRLIEQIARRAAVDCEHARDFPGYILGILEDPNEIWAHPFENQLCGAARDLLYTLASLPIQTPLHALSKASASFPTLTAPRDFLAALRITLGDCVQTDRSGGLELVGFSNPSLRDYVVGRMREDPSIGKDVLSRSIYFDQVKLVSGYDKSLLETEEFREAAVRTFATDSCVVINETSGGRVRATTGTVDPDERLLFVLRCGSLLDSSWLCQQVEELKSRWSRGRISTDAEELLDVLQGCLSENEYLFVLKALRDGLLDELYESHCAELFLWLRERHPGLMPEDADELAKELFAGYFDGETQALEQLNDAALIEDGIAEHRELGERFGVDVDSLDCSELERRVDTLQQREQRDEDDWRERYHEERQEMESDDRFIEDLFDGLGDEHM